MNPPSHPFSISIPATQRQSDPHLRILSSYLTHATDAIPQVLPCNVTVAAAFRTQPRGNGVSATACVLEGEAAFERREQIITLTCLSLPISTFPVPVPHPFLPMQSFSQLHDEPTAPFQHRNRATAQSSNSGRIGCHFRTRYMHLPYLLDSRGFWHQLAPRLVSQPWFASHAPFERGLRGRRGAVRRIGLACEKSLSRPVRRT